MARFYTQAEQRAFREKRRAQAALVADRLLGKKKVDPDVEDFFGGSTMRSPFQYGYSFGNMLNNAPGISSIISGIEGV